MQKDVGCTDKELELFWEKLNDEIEPVYSYFVKEFGSKKKADKALLLCIWVAEKTAKLSFAKKAD